LQTPSQSAHIVIEELQYEATTKDSRRKETCQPLAPDNMRDPKSIGILDGWVQQHIGWEVGL